MADFDRKQHWDNIYQTKNLKEVSWYQPTPTTSLELIKGLGLALDAKIIDVGGGDSLLVDHLLDMGYKNVTVLDISEAAILRARERLGEKATSVSWIVSDVAKFKPKEDYDLWHDRAAFHFLTDESEISTYVRTASEHIKPDGHLILGAFSIDGPTKCSGIEIKQYSEDSLVQEFDQRFRKINCQRIDHQTPSGAIQNFVFCTFQKKL